MEKRRNNEDIYRVTTRILKIIYSEAESSVSKANLASLRQSIGKESYHAIGVFSVIFSNLPEAFLGEQEHLSAEEQAIILSLQLYATHQQGFDVIKNIFEERRKARNIGDSLNSLRMADNNQAIDRRFNAMITSTSFNELSNHLRHMIKLLKSKSDAMVNYPMLAEDLYWFQRGFGEGVRLKWARSYYRNSEQKNERDEENK